MDYTNDVNFWKRLKSFVEDIQVNDLPGEEEKEMLINVSGKKIEDSLEENDILEEYEKCNRVEVIDEKGRSYVNWKPTNIVSISFQDKRKTLKIFISKKNN